MPDFGQKPLSSFADRLPAAAGHQGWDLDGARVLTFTFEVTKPQALPLLPATLIRPVPAYAKVLVIEADDSPVGPYREAMLMVGAREGMQIRNVLLDSIVGDAGTLDAAREAFGGSRRSGTVVIDTSGQQITVTIADQEGPLCALRMGALRRCDATMLKFDALLVPGETPGGPALLRWGVRVPLNEVEGTLSRDWEVTMARRNSPWWALRPACNVTAFQSFGKARIEAAHLPEAH